MGEHRDRMVEIAALAGSIFVLLLIFLPWVRTGALQESDTVNGVDIPVVGWSSIIMCLITVAFAVAGLIARNRWLWCAQTFSAALAVTGASVVLSTLDVLDSAVLGWVTEALPDSMDSVSPDVAATFMLWFTYVVAVLTVALGASAVLSTSRRHEEEGGDESGGLAVDPPAWNSLSSGVEHPSWMGDL